MSGEYTVKCGTLGCIKQIAENVYHTDGHRSIDDPSVAVGTIWTRGDTLPRRGKVCGIWALGTLRGGLPAAACAGRVAGQITHYVRGSRDHFYL